MGDKNNNPFFSIVIPAYNAEKYLEECVESISRQTFRDFEVVIVDDGSTDHTPALCDALPAKFPQVKFTIVHQANQGNAGARFSGISATKGAYLMFIDADDKYFPNALEVVKAAIDKWDADITVFNAVQFWEGGSEQFNPHYADKPFYMVGEDYKQFLYTVLSSSRFNPVWDKAYRRQVILDAVQMETCIVYRLGQDKLMLLPWLDNAKSSVYIPQNLLGYRLHLGSISFTYRNKDNNPLETALTFYNAIMKYSKKWGLENLETIIQKEFMIHAGYVANHIYGNRHKLSFKEKKAYLTELMNNEVFRKEMRGYKGSGTEGPLKLLILRLLYLKLWRLALFVIEHDPKLDRNRINERVAATLSARKGK